MTSLLFVFAKLVCTIRFRENIECDVILCYSMFYIFSYRYTADNFFSHTELKTSFYGNPIRPLCSQLQSAKRQCLCTTLTCNPFHRVCTIAQQNMYGKRHSTLYPAHALQIGGAKQSRARRLVISVGRSPFPFNTKSYSRPPQTVRLATFSQILVRVLCYTQPGGPPSATVGGECGRRARFAPTRRAERHR